MPNERPAAPWFSFLSDLDAQLREDVDLHCHGQAANQIAALAGKGSPLHRKYRVYLEHVGVTSFPDSYESRLIASSPSGAG